MHEQRQVALHYYLEGVRNPGAPAMFEENVIGLIY